MSTKSNQSSASLLKEHLLCGGCVRERYLGGEISRNGEIGECCHCRGKSKAITVEQIAIMIKNVVENYHKKVVENEEKVFGKDEDIINVKEIIRKCTDSDEELVCKLQNFLEEEYIEESENPFGTDARYTFDTANLISWQKKWTKLQDSITKRSRYFNRKAKKILDLVFEDISKYESTGGASLIIEYKEKETNFFRARVFHSQSDLDAALSKPVQSLGPPPSSEAKAGRLNARGIAVFYGATSKDLAIAEVRPPVGSWVVVASFENIRRIKLLDIEALRSVVKVSMLDPEFRRKSGKQSLFSSIGDKISAPVMRNDEPIDYLITQTIADYLSEIQRPLVDGILYCSTQVKDSESDRNVVIFHNSSHVKKRHPYEKIEVIKNDNSDNGPNINLVFNIEDDNDSQDAKIREIKNPTLRLNTRDMSVHLIQGVKFHKESYEVIWKPG